MEENNNFLYRGYLLVVEPHNICYWWSECKELEYYATNSSIPFLKELFKQFVDEKLEKEKETIEHKLFNYHGYLLTIKPVTIEHDLCGLIGIASFGYTIFHRFVGDTPEEIKEKFINYIDKNIEDKDKKIAELVKVIDGLNKKLEEKDKKIERLRSKIATVKLELNKAE